MSGACASDSQSLPFDDGAAPPSSVAVTKDATYSLAVPGGVKAMIAHGVPTRLTTGSEVLALQCTWSSTGVDGTSGLALSVTAEATNTKAEDTVGRFYGPITGRIRVDCAGWGAMFVPDSNDRPFDWSGLALLVAVIALTVGVTAALSELRLALGRARLSRDGDDDEDETDDEGIDEDDGADESSALRQP